MIASTEALIHPPNGVALMQRIVAAFHKVWGGLDEVLDHAGDPIYPGADGKLLGTG